MLLLYQIARQFCPKLLIQVAVVTLMHEVIEDFCFTAYYHISIYFLVDIIMFLIIGN